jgi:hypothetical protein
MWLVKPEMLLRCHRDAFRLWWRWKTRWRQLHTRISAETVALIRRLARDNRLWGAERIRGELLKLNIHAANRTIQRYLESGARPRSTGQCWSTFIDNHAKETWACDFL